MTMQIESSYWLAFHYTPYLLTLVYDLHSEEGKGSETFFPNNIDSYSDIKYLNDAFEPDPMKSREVLQVSSPNALELLILATW